MNKICADYMDNEQVYSIKTLLVITLIFMVLGFILLTTYKLPIVRYLIILSLTLFVIINRAHIVNHYIKPVFISQK